MVGKLDPAAVSERVRAATATQPLDAAIVRDEVRGARRRRRGAHRARAHRRADRRRLPRHRRREHGERDQAHLGAARLRRHRIHAVLVRRRRRPARLPRRRRARHDARVHPSAGRRAVRVRHGTRRRARAAAAGGRGAAVGSVARRLREHRSRRSKTPARRDVAAQGIAPTRIRCERTLHLKYEGTDTTLAIPADDAVAARHRPNSSAAIGSSTDS